MVVSALHRVPGKRVDGPWGVESALAADVEGCRCLENVASSLVLGAPELVNNGLEFSEEVDEM